MEYREYVAARAPALRRTAYLLCGDWNRAENAVQAVLIALYVPPPKSWEAVDSWVRTALVRKLIDESRRPWRRERSVEVLPETSWTHEDLGERMVVPDALRELPKRQRAVVVLRFWDDLSVHDTAAALDISEGTVTSNTARGLAVLRSPLQPREDSFMNPFENLTLIEPPLTITPDAVLAEGRRRVRRRRLLTQTAVPLALVGAGALAVSLLAGGPSTPTHPVVPPAGRPTTAKGSNPIALPSKDAASAEVLDAYLRALKAGDCKTAHALTTSSFARNGEICGRIRVKSYTPVGDPVTPGDQAIFSVNLITQGGDPALMPDGLHTRFYIMTRQQDSAWRVDSAGSGP